MKFTIITRIIIDAKDQGDAEKQLNSFMSYWNLFNQVICKIIRIIPGIFEPENEKPFGRPKT